MRRSNHQSVCFHNRFIYRINVNCVRALFTWSSETLLTSYTKLRHIFRKRILRQFQFSALCQLIQKYFSYSKCISLSRASVKNYNLHFCSKIVFNLYSCKFIFLRQISSHQQYTIFFREKQAPHCSFVRLLQTGVKYTNRCEISNRSVIGMTLNNTAQCTEEFCDIATPCTRIITISLQGWTLRS